MRRKRLLVVCDEMEVGGSQRQIVHLLSGLDRARWQPELLYFRESSFLAQELSERGIPVHRLNKRGRIDLVFLWRLATLLRRGHYDLVHAFSLTAEIWVIAVRPLLLQSQRLVASIRGLYQNQTSLFWFLKRVVVQCADATISNSLEGVRVASARTGLALQRFDVVSNGVPVPTELAPSKKSTSRTTLGAPPCRMLALFVGRMVPEKNVSCLLRALAMVPVHDRPWLALAGDGPLRAALEKQAMQLGISGDVKFLGERDDATTLMQVADVLVLPSSQEGLSNVLLEAMVVGCPVVASAVGGTPELVLEGWSGLLFSDDDADALAACLLRLSADTSTRRLLGVQAREHVRAEYSVEKMVAATTEVYERCLHINEEAATDITSEQCG